MSPYTELENKIEELEQCIEANDKRMQETEAENKALKYKLKNFHTDSRARMGAACALFGRADQSRYLLRAL